MYMWLKCESCNVFLLLLVYILQFTNAKVSIIS